MKIYIEQTIFLPRNPSVFHFHPVPHIDHPSLNTPRFPIDFDCIGIIPRSNNCMKTSFDFNFSG